MPLADGLRRQHGFPGLTLVAVPHPVGGIPRAEVVAKARAAAGEVAAALMGAMR